MASTSSSVTSITCVPKKNQRTRLPKDPAFKEKFGPRGVIHSWAQPDGTQKIEDTGPLTKKRMETIDEEVLSHSLRFIEENTQNDTPWFVWFNTTRMHVWTHLKPESEAVTGLGI